MNEFFLTLTKNLNMFFFDRDSVRLSQVRPSKKTNKHNIMIQINVMK